LKYDNHKSSGNITSGGW